MADQITISKRKLISLSVYVLLLALSVCAFYIGKNTAQPKTVGLSGQELTAKLQEAYLAGCTAAVLPVNVENFNQDQYKTDRDVCFSNSKNYSQN